MSLKLVTTKRCGMWASGGDWSDPTIWRDNFGNKMNRIPTGADNVYITGNVSGEGVAASVTVGTEEELKALVVSTLKYPPPPGWSLPTYKTFLAADPECCCNCHCPNSCNFECYAPVPALEVTLGSDDCAEGVSCYYSSYLGYHIWYYYPEYNYGEEPTPCLPCKFDGGNGPSMAHGSSLSVSMHCASGPKWIVDVETSCQDYGFWTPKDENIWGTFPDDFTYVPGVGSCTIRYQGEIGVSGCIIETGTVDLKEVSREDYPDTRGSDGFGGGTVVSSACDELNPSKPEVSVL